MCVGLWFGTSIYVIKGKTNDILFTEEPFGKIIYDIDINIEGHHVRIALLLLVLLLFTASEFSLGCSSSYNIET